LRNKLVYSLALLSIFLFFSATISSVTAVTYTPGVTAGTTATYSAAETGYSGTFTVSDSVTSVSGAKITFSVSGTWPNGTSAAKSNVVVDVSNGSAMPFFIGANLGVGDPVYSGSLFVINETITMSVAGASRTVNHVNWTFAFGGTLLFALNFYWDKPTGLCTGLSLYASATWINVTLTSTSLFGTGAGAGGGFGGLSSSTLLLIGGVVVVVVVVAVVVVVLRRRK
jgi:hypothetical protein